jgi:hypothetical protein
MVFDEALTEANERGVHVHALLGNGFSIACRSDCFTYSALLREASFDGASVDIRKIFDAIGTTDFEQVIDVLRLAAEVVVSYDPGGDRKLARRMVSDAEVVKTALATVLASRHPNLPTALSAAEYGHARRFLSNFERIYTLNYDMLMYWTVMQAEIEPDVVRNDGFGNPDDDDAPYVVWQPYVDYDQQRLFYLHGGLHLYDRGTELVKITWSRTDVPLVSQIRAALDEGRYPLIVTEGTAAQKEAKILHSAYLNHAIRSLSRITGSLSIFGHSFGASDSHILDRLSSGRVRALYVSLFGDPASGDNQALRLRAEALAAGRPANRGLEVRFFDAASAKVWG